MRDVLDELLRWWREGRTAGLATVVRAWQSAPRSPGSSMLVDPNGEVTGSVSGGCVEADVYLLAADPDQPPTVQSYGVSDDDAFAVGLTCGGVIDIFVAQISPATFPELDQVADAIRSGTPVAVVTCLNAADRAHVGRRLVVFADRTAGSLGSADLDATVGADTRQRLRAASDSSQDLVTVPGPAGLHLFVECHLPAPRMIVFGAIDFAVELARVGTLLGYDVTVCDARPVFATARRFPTAAEVVVEQPYRYLLGQTEAGAVDSRTVLCVLTHDAKFDVPLLEVALRLPVGYVGAMGSRRTHADRERRLRAAGLTDAELTRLRSPIGLDLGGRTPQETAISIAAEIVAVRRGGGGLPLTGGAGAIHRQPLQPGGSCQDRVDSPTPE
jgi:xanthine dehydrogenase accessory factor